MFTCLKCGKTFTRRDNLKRHMKNYHDVTKIPNNSKEAETLKIGHYNDDNVNEKFEDKNNTKLLEDLIKKRNIIRKKFNTIRSVKAERVTRLQHAFKSITKPINELLNFKNITNNNETATPQTSFVKFKRKYQATHFNTDLPPKIIKIEETTTPYVLHKANPNTSETAQTILEDNLFATPTGEKTSESSTTITEDPINEPPQQLINLLQTPSSFVDIDTYYGPYFDDDSNEWKIGNSDIKFDQDTISIDTKTYEGTPGIYELLFKRRPNVAKFTDTDLSQYKEILISSNAHKHNFESNNPVKVNNTYKYRNIIGKLFPHTHNTRKKSGQGLISQMYNNNNPVYVYWEDPNVLVDRLRFLIEKEEEIYNNEITSIVEAIRKANIIE